MNKTIRVRSFRWLGGVNRVDDPLRSVLLIRSNDKLMVCSAIANSIGHYIWTNANSCRSRHCVESELSGIPQIDFRGVRQGSRGQVECQILVDGERVAVDPRRSQS